MNAALGLVIVSVIMAVLFVLVDRLLPPTVPYDPHADPLFMQYHEPEFCPVCKGRRREVRDR